MSKPALLTTCKDGRREQKTKEEEKLRLLAVQYSSIGRLNGVVVSLECYYLQ